MSYLVLSSWGEFITLVLFNQQNEALVNLKKAKQMYIQKQQELEKVCYNPCKVLLKTSPQMLFYLFSLSDPSTYIESCHIKFVTISTALSCATFLCCTGCKESHFHSLSFGQAEASIYQPKRHFNQPPKVFDEQN